MKEVQLMKAALKTSNTENDFERKGRIMSLYGKFSQHIENLSQSVVQSSTGNVLLLKDIMPDKKDQTAIFREIRKYKFKGSGIEFLSWMSLARVLNDFETNIDYHDITKTFRNLIKHSNKFEGDMVNILYLLNSNSEAFYHYFKFEIEKTPPPFNIPDETSEVDLLPIMKLTGLATQYKELFFWEIRSGRQHPEHNKLLDMLLAV